MKNLKMGGLKKQTEEQKDKRNTCSFCSSVWEIDSLAFRLEPVNPLIDSTTDTQ